MSDAPVPVKARYVLLWLLPAILIGSLPSVIWPESLGVSGNGPLFIAVLAAGIEGSWFGLTVGHAYLNGLKIPDLFRFAGVKAWRLALVALPMVGSAIICLYLVFVPLSLVFPDAVQWWLFDDQPELYLAGPPYPLLPNLASFVSVCLIGPIAEEWVFRGLLLRRWSEKVGAVRAVVRTSLLFGLLHADPFSSFIFSVTMAGLYARYRTLWAPIIVHIANNSLAFGATVVFAHTNVTGPDTVEEFRAQWWLLLLGAALTLPWLLLLRRSWVPIAHWRFEPAARMTALPITSQTEGVV